MKICSTHNEAYTRGECLSCRYESYRDAYAALDRDRVFWCTVHDGPILMKQGCYACYWSMRQLFRLLSALTIRCAHDDCHEMMIFGPAAGAHCIDELD